MPTTPAAPTTPSDLFREGVRLLLADDVAGWVDLFAEDGVAEFPFAPEGYPRRIEGRDAIGAYLRGLGGQIAYEDFPYVDIHETTSPERIVVEMRATGRVTTTGDPFDMTYVAVVTVRDGHFTHYRDYWNPLGIPGALKEAVGV
ncbi:nuclear transport factor 2 family protein [Streptomyces flavofungini]|uniref:nuclear transport factor 2 family protein n=1 Tax=Streptomyces flavofungini TaxID=68200 RepID=UPI0025B1F822|nr:nuclear transport factor 2 family protein [Streptomyces flavofungini]WJV48799.1 nuclear transport factor 2 family protein [Streptomyces flavofungini]